MTRLRGAMLLVSALLIACGDDLDPAADMSAVTTCAQMCSRFLVCEQQADPMFMGSTTALVPCENTCFAATEQVRGELRVCYERSCGEFISCAKAAGLKLGQKPTPDAGMDLATAD